MELTGKGEDEDGNGKMINENRTYNKSGKLDILIMQNINKNIKHLYKWGLVLFIAYLLAALILIIILISSVSAQESSITANVQVVMPFEITINSPIADNWYNTRNILLDVSLSGQVSKLYYSINSGSYSRLCSNCNSYSGTKKFVEGTNNLTIQSLGYLGAVNLKSIFFYTDTIKPQIQTTFPSNQGNGLFGVQYTEVNLKEVSLYYGLSSSNMSTKVIFTGCNSGIKIWCYNSADLSAYNGRYIYYRFLLKDSFFSTYSSTRKILVNTAVAGFSQSTNLLSIITGFFSSLI